MTRLNNCVSITPISWTSSDRHRLPSGQQLFPSRWAVIKHHTAILLDACDGPETIVAAISKIWSLKHALNKQFVDLKNKRYLVIQAPGSNRYCSPLFRQRCPYPPPREVPVPTSAGYRSRDGGAKTSAFQHSFSPSFLYYIHPSQPLRRFPVLKPLFLTTFRRARFSCRRRAMMA